MFLQRTLAAAVSLGLAVGCQAQPTNSSNTPGANVTSNPDAPVMAETNVPLLPPLNLQPLDVQPANEPPTLTLQQVIGWALEKNPAVRGAAKRVEEFKAYAEIARRKILPGIGVSAGYNRSDLGYGTQQYAVGINHTVWDGTYKANVMMNAFRFMAEQEREKQIRRQISLQAATAYLNLFKSLSIEKAQKATYDATERVYNQVKFAYSLGLATKQQLFLAEAELKKAELAVVQSQSGVRTSCLAVLNATATTQTSVCARPAPPTQPEFEIPATPDEAVKAALMNRPEPKIEIFMVEAAKKGVSIARAEYYPKVNVNANYGFNDNPFRGGNSGPSTGPGSLEKDWSVGISISVPIFDWGTRKKKVEAAQAQVEQALAGKETTELEVSNNILTLLSQLEVAGQSVETAAVAFASADNAFKESEAAYKLGGLSLTDLMLRVSERLAAEQRLIEAQSVLVQTLLSTKVALGKDLEEAQ